MSKKQKLTPWFPADVKPVRVGVYQREYSEGPAYCWWGGTLWSTGVLVEKADALDRAGEATFPSPMQDLRWRGLAKEPK